MKDPTSSQTDAETIVDCRLEQLSSERGATVSIDQPSLVELATDGHNAADHTSMDRISLETVDVLHTAPEHELMGSARAEADDDAALTCERSNERSNEHRPTPNANTDCCPNDINLAPSSDVVGSIPAASTNACKPCDLSETLAQPTADQTNTDEASHARDVRTSRDSARTAHATPVETTKLLAIPDLRSEVFTTPTLFHFASSVGVTRVLERLVENALANNRPLDHVLLHGPPGSGTTLVARAMVRDLAPKHFVELDLLEGVDHQTLRRAIREVRNKGVLLIRHIELMGSADEQFLTACIARKMTRGTGSFARDPIPGQSATERKKPSVEEFQVDASSRRALPRIDGNFTIIATAHLTQQIGYQLRNRFDHMIHLRSDAVGVRIAMNRALTRHGLLVEETAHAPMEHFVRTIDDVAEQFVRAIVMRAQLDETSRIDAPLVRAVVTEDMPARLADEVYGWALNRHLAGRRVTAVTDNEVERIDSETGWGEIAVRAALGAIVRNAAARAVPPAA